MTTTMHQKPIVFLFSGQGSHYFHMGKALLIHNPTFRHWMHVADDLLKAKAGLSVLDCLYAGDVKKGDLFNNTVITHPALFMVQYALAKTLIEYGFKPDYVIGTSLGEFVAATIAGYIAFEAALNAVVLQAQLIDKYCQSANMLAVLHSPDILDELPILKQHAELASINFDQHFVITCHHHIMNEIVNVLKNKNITHQILGVRHGFHSSHIDNAAIHFINAINNIKIKSPAIPMISCMTTTQHENIDSQYLWDVIRKPILFKQTINELEKHNNYIYVDIGPSATLATFIKYNLNSASTSIVKSILSPYGNDLDNLSRFSTVLSTE